MAVSELNKDEWEYLLDIIDDGIRYRKGVDTRKIHDILKKIKMVLEG